MLQNDCANDNSYLLIRIYFEGPVDYNVSSKKASISVRVTLFHNDARHFYRWTQTNVREF